LHLHRLDTATSTVRERTQSGAGPLSARRTGSRFNLPNNRTEAHSGLVPYASEEPEIQKQLARPPRQLIMTRQDIVHSTGER
jgi:hypothetical protein